MTRPVSVGLVVFVVAITVAGVTAPLAMADTPAVSSPEPTAHPNGEQTAVPATQSAAPTQEFDSTRFEITVYENGTAQWTFEHRQRLADSDEEAQFAEFAESFESDDPDSEASGVYDRFTTQAEALTERGATVTDREMDARDFSRSARIEEGLNPTGVVEMSFTWDEFAVVDDGSVIVGDVFSDLYITSDQSIRFRAGGDLVFEEVSPDDAVSDTGDLETATMVRWDGEREFVAGQPRIVFDDPTVSSGGSDGSPTSSDVPTAGWLVAILAFAAAIGGAALWYRRSDGGESEATDGSATPAETPTEKTSDSDERSTPLSDEELLTDEDRVVKLIRENGGRMKQVDIVEDTGWSKSKVSMLLSDMEEEGIISKLRVGRENIISLEGFEPEATKSPFDE